ncbi:MAG TPA: hypothetical protein VEA69_15050 [Tepidisphaeraceae bacterium]|nr:hypothetical protein [Tepidisphaeraceae bacterium]
MVRILIAMLAACAAVHVPGAEPAPAGGDATLRVELPLKTPRKNPSALGGAPDKVAVTVWIPANTPVLRGGICNPFARGDEPGKHWQAACRHWGFAYVQIDLDGIKKDEYPLLFEGLSQLAKQANRPELAHLPMCYTGMSRGGGMSMQLAEMKPERAIAVAPVCLEVGAGSEATRQIPVGTVFGEKDGSQMAKLLEKLPAERAKGARFAITVQWGRKHEFALANNMSFVLFDDAIRLRLPNVPVRDGPTPLAEVSPEAGWLGDVTAWGKDGRVPAIAPSADFKREKDKACWFPTGRSAAVWRAFVAGANDVTIADPPGLGDKQPFVPQSATKAVAVKVGVADGLKPAKLELWDADVKVAEKATGPWEFSVPLEAGIHSLIAIVETAGGRRTVSRPHTIVVER